MNPIIISRLIHSMRPDTIPTELIEHLQRISSLDSAKAQQLVEEVLSFYQEGVDQYITRRHSELQFQGLANSKIYSLISQELAQRCFAAPTLSERQIRRVIYG